jgi:hypothetical protein
MTMSLSEKSSLSEESSERRFQVSAPSENWLLAAIVICFVILHILAGTIMTSARQGDVHQGDARQDDAVTAPEPPGVSSGD